MGACCVKQHNQDQNEFNNGEKKDNVISLLKSDKDAIVKIVKIQSAIRRYMAMKQYKAMKAGGIVERAARPLAQQEENPPEANAGVSSNPEAIPETIPVPAPEVAADSAQNGVVDSAIDNTKVKELESKLGPFVPEPRPADDVKREKRPTVVLDNGAKYTGEW